MLLQRRFSVCRCFDATPRESPRFGHVIDGMPPGLDGSVLVTVDAFLHQHTWPTTEEMSRAGLRESHERVLFTGNEQSPEFLAGRPVKKSSLTQPFYRP
jgi:hypothetical protein